ncbi:ion channel [Flavobacterium sp. H122]|uniref:ion channel n=1 Tax=Flavobacterium sp. H122 TaxID=2529860 RepID=UPI0010AA9B22|nr:ion channel [Flavobacterium sp. H122]
MAFTRKRKKILAATQTGFGSNPENYGGRFINKDGSANVVKTGIPFIDQISWFHTLLEMPGLKFFTVILSVFLFINLFFTCVYYLIGIENLNGVTAVTEIEKFGQAYFFSAQTFTTVGYGHISPKGFWISFTAALEALSGLLAFAIATGLLYGRFSKPKAHILFSENALIAPFNDGKALMVRLAPFKNVNLSDATAKLTMGLEVEEKGKKVYKFFNLDLEYDVINLLTLNWTIVHPITEDSPLFEFKAEDFKGKSGEIILYINAFDDMFSTVVARRTSYTFDEVVYGAKFLPMFEDDDSMNTTILHLDKLNEFKNVDLM